MLRAQQAEARIAALEAEIVQATHVSVHAAAEEAAGMRKRLQEAELAWLRERQQLSDELVKSKVQCPHLSLKRMQHLAWSCCSYGMMCTCNLCWTREDEQASGNKQLDRIAVHGLCAGGDAVSAAACGALAG